MNSDFTSATGPEGNEPVRPLDPHTAAVLRAALWEAGYRPVPVHGPNSNVDPKRRCKAPFGPLWQTRARATPPACLTEDVPEDATNVGLLCDALRVVDLDCDDPEAVARLHEAVVEHLGPTPCTRTRSNSPRCVMLYRSAEGQPVKRVAKNDAGSKVEVLGHGQQVVAYGMHPTGADLRWGPQNPFDVPHDALPAVTEEQVEAFLCEAAKIIGGRVLGTPRDEDLTDRAALPTPAADHRESNFGLEDVRVALAVIPPTSDHDEWLRVGMAVHHASNGDHEGLEAFITWSAGDPSYPGRAEVVKRWRSMRPSRITYRTLIALARAADPDWSFPSQEQDEERKFATWIAAKVCFDMLCAGTPLVAEKVFTSAWKRKGARPLTALALLTACRSLVAGFAEDGFLTA